MNTEKKAGLTGVQRNMIVTTLIILFFLGVIILYYVMLRNETRNSIIRNGEINAVSAANRIDKYLSTGVDAITLTGYTLDNMIRDRRSQEEILDYLVNQSIAVENLVSGQANGVYGYINGEYLDGSLWKPDDDYVPTRRPWYTAAIARSGKVTLVDPYIDAMTGNMMITMTKTLCDATSVVAIDVAMNRLQTTTEEIAAQGHSDMEIVLNRRYQVIAHSDAGEVGKDYAAEVGTLGNAIMTQLRKQPSGENAFSVYYGGAEYIVYAITIENDWMCVSVTNATSAFSRLRIPLILTVIVSVLIIAVLLILMIRSNRKDAFARKMKQLAEQQTEYAYNDQMTGLKNRRAYTEKVEKLAKALPENCCVIMFDVNGLKKINDTYGHEAGDELIIAAAKCIREAFPETEDVFRLGGDEFCVMTRCTEEAAMQSLIQLEQRTARWRGRRIDGFSVSYGIGTAAEHANLVSIMQEADRRMYEYKSAYYEKTGNDRRRT